MKNAFGADAGRLKRGEFFPVEWNSVTAVNGHMLFMGVSGAGKAVMRATIGSGFRSKQIPLTLLSVR